MARSGVFAALSLAWGVLVEGFSPDLHDVLGVPVVCGGVMMVVPAVVDEGQERRKA